MLEEPEEISKEVPPNTPPSSQPATPFVAHGTSPPSMGDNIDESYTNQSRAKIRSLMKIYEQTEDGETNILSIC